jgi:hypothetical protein
LNYPKSAILACCTSFKNSLNVAAHKEEAKAKKKIIFVCFAEIMESKPVQINQKKTNKSL